MKQKGFTMNYQDKTVYESENNISEQKVNNNFSDTNPEKKNKNSKLKNIIILLVNLLIVLAILFYNITQNKDFTPLSELSFDFKYLLVLFLIFIATIMLDTLINSSFVKSATGKRNIGLSYRSFAIMRYYDSITPMGAGGQPFMGAYLLNNNIQGTQALSIPVKKFLTQQFSWLIVTSFGLAYTIANGTKMSPLILGFSIFGFVVNLFLDLFILLGSSSEKITAGLSVWFIKLLAKVKIVKNYDAAVLKATNFMKGYQEIMKEFSDNKKQFIFTLFVGIIKNLLYFTIPFFIYCCFKPIDTDLFVKFLTFTIMVELSACCFPLPGGSGMNEITFSVIFKEYLPDAVFWAMLFWRLFSYYGLILQGILVMAYDVIPKKTKKSVKKLNLESNTNSDN